MLLISNFKAKAFNALMMSFTILLLSVPLANAKVVTSVRPIGLIAAAITEGVTITEVLLPNGASPHNYALRPSDIQKMNNAELIVWIGPEMEVFLQKTIQKISPNKKLTLTEQKAIRALMLENEQEGHEGHGHGDLDTHIWLSPAIAKEIATVIYADLLAKFPAQKAQLDVNFNQFTQQLEQTVQNIDRILAPVKSKGYFVFHDAYRYFENAFGLTQLGHFTLNPEIQPGVQRLSQIKAELVKRGAVCIFSEPQFKPIVIDAVSKGVDVRRGELDPLGIDVPLNKNSYMQFLTQLSEQFASCLQKEI